MGVDQFRRQRAEHIPLSTAAVVVYRQVTGTAAEIATADEILNRVALALSRVAPIYSESKADGTLRELQPLELIEAEFKRGATILVAKNRTEFRGLTMQRGDVQAAIPILKAARIRFQDSKREK